MGQFGFHILSLGEQALGSSFQQRICDRKQFRQWRESARRHRIKLAAKFPGEVGNALGVNNSRRAGDANSLAQEGPSFCCFRSDGLPPSFDQLEHTQLADRGIRRLSPDRPICVPAARSREAAASRRCGVSIASARSKPRSNSSGRASRAAARQSDQGAPLFHVKQGRARAPERDRR